MKPWYPHKPYPIKRSDWILAGFSVPVTTYVLSSFAVLVQGHLKIEYNGWFELAMVLGQIVFQLGVIRKMKSRWIPYALHLLQVSLIGSILLFPLLVINHFFLMPTWQNVAYFFLVVLVMFSIHKKRVELLRLPWFVCYTWVLYRVIILVCILKV
jgi:hypothetical protein